MTAPALHGQQWRETVLSLSSPIAQRYVFARYVLGCTRMEAVGIAATFQDTPLDEHEYDTVAAGWDAA